MYALVLRGMQGHTGVVNSCSISRTGNLVASGSDDGFIKLWDPRVRRSVGEFMNQYQVTAVCLSRDEQQVLSGGIDNDIKVFDVRKQDLDYAMPGHTDTVTGKCTICEQRRRLSPEFHQFHICLIRGQGLCLVHHMNTNKWRATAV